MKVDEWAAKWLFSIPGVLPLVKLAGNPTGPLAKFVGRGMNLGHSSLQHWGISHISIGPEARILDVGCGGGKAVRELAIASPKRKVFGVDYSEDMVKLAQSVNKALIKERRVGIKFGSVSSLPFLDNRFDLVTAFEAYYYWDLMDGLKEIKRVLRPGGILLIVNDSYKHERFAKRNEKLARIGLQLHAPVEYWDFLTEAGYIDIEIDEIIEKNWITAIGRKEKDVL